MAPANSSFTSLAFAFISLLGLVCTTSGHISGIDSQFGPFRQISRHSLGASALFPNTSNSLRPWH